MNSKIDALEVNRRADLLTLASSVTALGSKPVASTGGGEYCGPCPFCGGKDRFRVQPNHQPYGLWMCHHCTDNKWKDSIEFGRRLWPGLKFPEICERLTGGSLPTTSTPRPAAPPRPAYAPPSEQWQAAGRMFIERCQAELWGSRGSKALEYLHGRGLQDETIKRFKLGFNPDDQHQPADAWGLDGKTVFIDKGITIPCFAREQLWYIKIRRAKDDPKYRNIRGSRPEAIFNADDLEAQPVGGGPALFVEGEFDCMLTWQEAGGVLPVATLGPAKNEPDLATWGRYFLDQRITMICYDNDEAGRAGEEVLCKLARYPIIVCLPDGPWKDATDFHKAGGDLGAWIDGLLAEYDRLGIEECLP